MLFWEILQKVCFILLTILGLCYAYQFLYVLLPLLFHNKWDAHGIWDTHAALSPTVRGIAILIAARNEETVLPHLLHSIENQDVPFSLQDVYIAADNCTDNTIGVASGANVYERHDMTHVGKGYALDWLITQLKKDGAYARYDGFLILDADNLLSPTFLTNLHQTFRETDETGQPKYGIVTSYRNAKNFGQSWLTSGYGLWFLHDSGHLNRSRQHLGLCCTLSGTGFCVRRTLLDNWGGWVFHTLTEDLECTAHIVTEANTTIGYCHDAILYDEQPVDFRQSIRQRIRWTQGGIQVSLRYGRAYLRGLSCGKLSHGSRLRQWFSCLENYTLSLWGYGAMTILTLLNLCCSAVLQEPQDFATALFVSVGSFFITGWGLGIATVVSEGKRIHSTKGEIVRGVLTFPIFLASFALSVALAFVSPWQWKPIRHTEAVSLDTVVGKIS